MSDHYFTEKPTVEEKLSTWETKLNDGSFTFTTSAGVFSKNDVDYGSRLLIETIKKPNIEAPILDLGCGYGPIGLSLAKKHPNTLVKMIDINERAIKMSKINAQQNKVTNVEIRQSNGFEELSDDEKFSMIVSNPPIRTGKKFIYSLFEESKKHLSDQGELWIVIQKKQGALSAFKFLEEHFEKVIVEKRKKGFFIIRAILN